MDGKHIRVWPLGEYPTDSMDFVNAEGDVILTISAMDPEDQGEPLVLVEDKHVHVLVRDAEITGKIVERELDVLSKATSMKWLYVDSDEKFIELLENLRKRVESGF